MMLVVRPKRILGTFLVQGIVDAFATPPNDLGSFV